MPDLENPTFYERADGIAPGRVDDFLKWIDRDNFIDDTAEVESPLGWVGLVYVDRDMIAEYVSTFGDPWLSESRNFSPGWYIVRINSDGLVWGMFYGVDGVYNEERARTDFIEAQNAYEAWLESEENSIEF